MQQYRSARILYSADQFVKSKHMAINKNYIVLQLIYSPEGEPELLEGRFDYSAEGRPGRSGATEVRARRLRSRGATVERFNHARVTAW